MNQTNLQLLSQGFLDRLPLGIVMVDDQGLLSYLNKSAVNMLEINLYELIDKPFWDLMRNDELFRTVADMKKGVTRQASIPVEYKNKLLMLSVSALDSPHLGHGAMMMCIEDQTQFRDIERIKRDFISVLLHRLRTPLTTIKSGLGFTTGSQGKKYSDEINDVMSICAGETNRMILFLNDLRDLFLIDAKMIDMSMDQQLVMIEPLMNEIMKNIEQQKMAEHLQITLDIQSPDAMIHADPDRLKQAVNSIINNAIKFSGNGGKVSVTVKTDDYIRIIVEDTGIGIPPGELPMIFEKFFRGDNAVTRDTTGYGLGLYLARYMVERMGGRILAFSDPGAGSRFEILLPK